MGRILLLVIVGMASASAATGQSAAPATVAATDTVTDTKPLPPVPQLLLDVERNQKAAEALRKDYTYHVHLEEQELGSNDQVKKNIVIDSESLNLRGVRINRVVARDGKPLTPDEAAKENERIDKEVAKDTGRREKNESKGESTDTRGDVLISASRILELGAFSNPRRVTLNGRPTIVVDFAGDSKAKTRNSAEGVIRDLVGTVWIDEQDRFLSRAQGHFLNDFKIGGGLVADVKKDSAFDAQFLRINDEVWLPAEVNGHGKVRILLVSGFNGRIHLVTSDYRKFRTSSTIVSGGEIVAPDAPSAPAPTAGPLPQKALNGTREQPQPSPCESKGVYPTSPENRIPAKVLQGLNVRRLPALWPLHHIELNGLSLLQALKPVRVDRGIMHEHVFAVLPADEAKTLGVVEPLHCSLFHVSKILVIDF